MQNVSSLFVPGDYFIGLKHHWKDDLLSGIVVALMALPMSLGIALASGFPPIAGVFTAIIGGIVVSFISGSQLSIKGPAGGLSAIALGSVMLLGSGDVNMGYKYTLAAILIAGLFQIFFGMAKLGNLGDFFPASVVHGMLAALGFMMAVKQLHVCLGSSVISNNTWELLAAFPSAFTNIQPKILLVGLLSLAIMISFSVIKTRFTKMFPAPLMVVSIVVPLSLIMGLNSDHQYQFNSNSYIFDPAQFLIQVPNNLSSILSLPSFTKMLSLDFWSYVFMFAIAGSIESLITTKAVDKLDQYHRSSDHNQDLLAIGIGNVICGMFGGLPMIAESKRSVINVSNGGTTRWSNFFHGVFLCLLILVAIPFINLIPMAALAAMLVFSGAKMALPSEFSKSYRIGKEQLLVFLTVFFLTITYNFLVGILAGIVLEILVNMRFGASIGSLFKANLSIKKQTGFTYLLKVDGPAIFSNFLWAKGYLNRIPNNSHLIFDFSKSTIVDHSFLEHLHHTGQARNAHGGSVEIIGLDFHNHLSEHPLAAKRISNVNIQSERQVDLETLATISNYSFDARINHNLGKFDVFIKEGRFTQSIKENSITFNRNRVSFEIADLHLTTTKALQAQHYTMTAAIVDGFGFDIPKFLLQKEGFIETFFHFGQLKDIDFKDYPKFSYYYLLTGQDEMAIRKFFRPGLLLLFEEFKGYNVECIDGKLLIYKRMTELHQEEVVQLIDFVKQLSQTIYSLHAYLPVGGDLEQELEFIN